MKKLPEVNVNFGELYKMLIAPVKSKLLLTGIELKVFNHLSEPKSARMIAKTISTHPDNTRLFLDGLVSCGLIEKKKGLYQNRLISQTYLVEGSPVFLGEFFTNMVQTWFDTINNLSELVRNGPPSPSQETKVGSEETWAQFAVYMANSERAVAVQQVTEIVSKLPEFQSFQKMLDLGGGPGFFGMAIVAAHKTMKGVIYDKPATVKVSKTFIEEYGMEDRVEVLGGDFIHNSIGSGYDLIWARAVLTFCKDDMNSFMKKIYDALNPGGVFISCHGGLTNERTGPGILVLGWLTTALMGRDMGLDQGFIADSMLYAGFRSVRSYTIDSPMGPMDMDIGRK